MSLKETNLENLWKLIGVGAVGLLTLGLAILYCQKDESNSKQIKKEKIEEEKNIKEDEKEKEKENIKKEKNKKKKEKEIKEEQEIKEENYRKQAHQNKEKNKGKEEGPSSKNSLFHFLEKNLLEISYISNREKRQERIKKLYEWFKNKRKYEEDIRTITMKTYKEKGEIDEQEALLMKTKDDKQKSIDDSAHRNLELINKKMLDEYERKRLRGPSWSISKLSSSQSLPLSILGKDAMMQTLSIFSGTEFQTGDFSTLYSSANGTNNFTKKNYELEIPLFIDKPEGGILEKDYIEYIHKL